MKFKIEPVFLSREEVEKTFLKNEHDSNNIVSRSISSVLMLLILPIAIPMQLVVDVAICFLDLIAQIGYFALFITNPIFLKKKPKAEDEELP